MPVEEAGVGVGTELARSVLKDRGLDILQDEKHIRLMNSLFYGLGMREGRPSLKYF